MKIDWSFPKRIFVALVILAALSVYPLKRLGDAGITSAAILGAVLMTVNVLLGYASIEYSYGKSTATFFTYVLGGMGLRMFLMAGVLVVLIRVFGVHVGGLIVSMGIIYVVFLVLEILHIQKKVYTKQEN